MKNNIPDKYHQPNPPTDRNLEAIITSAQDRSRWEDSNLSLININDSLNISIQHDDLGLPKPGAVPQQVQSNDPACNKDSFRINQQSYEMKENQSTIPQNTGQLSNKSSSEAALRKSEVNTNRVLKKNSKTKKRSSRVYPGGIESNNVLQTANSENRLDTETESATEKPIQLKDLVVEHLTEEQKSMERIEIPHIKPLTTKNNQQTPLEVIEAAVSRLEGDSPYHDNENIQRSHQTHDIPNTPSTLRGGIQDFVLSERNAVSPSSRQLTTNHNDIPAPVPVNQQQRQVRVEEPQVRRGPSRDDLEASNQEASTDQPTLPHLGSGPRLEVKPYLRKRIGLFGAFSAACLLVSLWLDGKVSLQTIIYPFYVYLGYLAVEGIIGGYSNNDIHPWKKRDHKLNTMVAVSYIIALVFIQLKLAGIISGSVLAAIPLCAATTLYALSSTAPERDRFSSSLWRCLLCLQAVLVTLKIDDIVGFDWTFGLIICLVYSGVVAMYCVIYALFIYMFFYIIMFQDYQGGSIGKKKQFMGLCWYFFYYGLGVLAFLIIIGINGADENPPNINILQGTVKFGFGFNIFLLAYTILAFDSLEKFIVVHFELHEDESQVQNGGRRNNVSGPVISFRVEKENRYFMYLSSTYFLPLKQGFLLRAKPNLAKIKALLKEFKEFKLRKLMQKQAKGNEDKSQNCKEKDIEALQKSKEALDGKLKNILENKPKCACVSPVHKFLKLFSPKNFEVPPKCRLETEFSAVDLLRQQSSKISLSVDNVDKFEEIRSARKHELEKEDDKVCYLCYAGPANSILMNCGHGGICYDCAIAAIQAKNECIECRAPVYEIHKIDMNKKAHNIVRAIEIRKVIVRQPVSRIDLSFDD